MTSDLRVSRQSIHSGATADHSKRFSCQVCGIRVKLSTLQLPAARHATAIARKPASTRVKRFVIAPGWV